MTTGELKSLAEAHTNLHDALINAAGYRGIVDTRRLGYFLARHAGQIVDGTRLVLAGTDRRKQAAWSLQNAG